MRSAAMKDQPLHPSEAFFMNSSAPIVRVARESLVITCSAVAVGMLALAGCATPQQRVQSKEDSLAAAGFLVKPANTPERESMLQRLPAHRFVEKTKDDSVDYVYADPLVCNCLYVGDQNAYNRLKDHERQQRLADQQEMTAQMYQDARWNWGAWGPWGPAYGFGPGLGW
jgi:hypothetical protein